VNNLDVKLTKDADKMLCEIYAAYLNRRSTGDSKSSAIDFTEPSAWPDPSWDTPDGSSAISELKRAGMLKVYITGGFRLNDEAIIYMENRFKNGVSEVLDWLGKIKSAIPFV
jgi:hypothetical protein